MFFSEEEALRPAGTERLFYLRRSRDRAQGLYRNAGAEHKSLLLLFFRKEELPAFHGICLNLPSLFVRAERTPTSTFKGSFAARAWAGQQPTRAHFAKN
jgi:hypothetical protein